MSDSKRNPRLASRLRKMGLGRVVDSYRVREILGVPQNEPVAPVVPARRDKMRIGLIGINIYAKFLNFACDLHVFAFQEFLKGEGHEVAVLDYKPVRHGNFDMRHPQAYTNKKYQQALDLPEGTSAERKHKRGEVHKWQLLAEGYESVRAEREVRYDKFQAFVGKNLQLTKAKYDSDLLEVFDPGFDSYICVTDVIWQSIERHQFDRGFLLGSRAFEGKPKISYAASRGAAKDYSEADQELFLRYFNDIDDVSVREEDFASYIESLTGTRVPTVLDPVMLHDQDFWNRYAKKPEEEEYVLLYYVMEKSTDTIQMAVDYAKANDLTLVELSDRPLKNGLVTDPDVKRVARYDVGMDEWLGYIRHARTVFTNSFHGCCFSVIFEKQIYAGARNGAKVPNFLATFGLDDQRFDATTTLDELAGPIDFAPVRKNWARERERSEAFLRQALAKAEQKVKRHLLIDHSRYDERRRSLEYPVRYHSGKSDSGVTVTDEAEGRGFSVTRTASGASEGTFASERFANSGSEPVPESPFAVAGKRFSGWRMRFKIDNGWFWVMDDGTVQPRGRTKGKSGPSPVKLTPGDPMPHLPVNHISLVVLEANWE